MTRGRALGLAGSSGLTLLAALSGLRTDTAAAQTAGMTSFNASFESAALRSRLHFQVHLPASYATGSARYPVLYFLHGLPASASSYLHLNWVADALAQSGRDAILVTP
ncbi:MAG: hypothetical protein QOI27_901, partial [Gaiellaceae bacterium]|nr:hypothetical protein [Gaiellaceae bacterium]